MTKTELRAKYKNLRSRLSYDQIDDLSLSIANNTLTLDIWQYTYYHIFLPINEQKEINTEYILNILSGKDKSIVVSKSNFKSITMSHYLLTDNTKLRKNSYNIPEPVDGITIESNIIDVVFIPLLAYDIKGNRIGYGKGFYDRFLADCKAETLKIGLSFFEPETNIIKASKNDIKLDYCITPIKVYKFK